MKNNVHFEEVSKLYDELADHGPYGTLAPNNRGGRKSQYVAAVFDAALLPALKTADKKGTLLDFGCGTGIFSMQAARFVEHVIGVDVSDQMVATAEQVCREVPNTEFMTTNGTTMPLQDKQFEWVVARESICYVPDDELEAVLRDLFRVLKPGGLFFWLEQVSENTNWQEHPDAPYLVKRAPAKIKQVAQLVGFELQSEAVVRTPRFPWIFPVWFGLVPRSLIPVLARWEVRFHQVFGGFSRRWWDSLFTFRRPE